MPEPEYQQTPEVTTEPQRQALDEMSRQLVERLNEMVQEQRERAERFAATQHSLSALPGQQPEVPDFPAPPLPQPATPAPQPRTLIQTRRRKVPTLPPRPAQPIEAQDFDVLPPAESPPSRWSKLPVPTTIKKPEESGCGTVPTIVGIIILLILLRACG